MNSNISFNKNTALGDTLKAVLVVENYLFNVVYA